MPAVSTTNLTINFDSNITQVIINDQTFTSSGETKSISGIVGMELRGEVTLKDNYIIDTVSGANKITDYSFNYTFTTTDTIITITSKLEDEYTAEIYLLNDTLILTNTFEVDNLDFKYDGSQFHVIRLTKDSSDMYRLNFLDEISSSISTQIYYGLSGGSLTTSTKKLYFKNKVTDTTLLEFFNTNATKLSMANKVSIDLTTLTDWDNVTDGEHQISVVAKATGYRDSAKSTPITFTKASVSTGETWVLNEDLSSASSISADVNFISHSTNYIKFSYQSSKGGTLYYVTAASGEETPYMTGSWTNTAYKTITFSTAPTGALLTWLQANGTKQGGTAAHKLTWSDSTMIVTVNGNAATSPYTLANGDEISLKRTSGYQSINIITDTGAFDTDTTQSPLAVSNSDIKLQNGNVDMSPSMKFGFAINYTE